MIRRLLLTLCWLLLLALTAHAERVYLEGGFTRDGDEGEHYRLFTGYRHTGEAPFHWELDVAGGARYYREDLPGGGPTAREDFAAARLGLKGSPSRHVNAELRLEQLEGNGWNPLLAAGLFTATPGRDWYLEMSAERELVDTVRAIREEVTVDTYGVSADYALTPSLTLVGALLHQDFSDGNRRLGEVARLIYTPANLAWLSLQLKGRNLEARQESATYFSPERLQEALLLVGITTPFADDHWLLRLLAGPGIQVVEPFDAPREEKAAYLGELQLRGWFSDHLTLESRTGCSTAVTSGDSYAYCYGHLHLGYAW